LDKPSIDERLARIERMLLELAEKVARLEESLGGGSGEATLSVLLAQALGLSALEAVNAALRLRNALKRLGKVDPITRSILEALSSGEWVTISELTRRVRSIRGRASRTIVRERVERLETLGIVEVRREVNKTLVRLKEL